MFCLKCGQGLPEGSQFCLQCGTELPIGSAHRSAIPRSHFPNTTAKGRDFEAEVAEWMKTRGYSTETNKHLSVADDESPYECDVHAYRASPLQDMLRGMIGLKDKGHHIWIECKDTKVIRDHAGKMTRVVDNLPKYKKAKWRPRHVMIFTTESFDRGALLLAQKYNIHCYQRRDSSFEDVNRSGPFRTDIHGVVSSSSRSAISNSALRVVAIAALLSLGAAVVSLSPARWSAPRARFIAPSPALRVTPTASSLTPAPTPKPTSKPTPEPTPFPASYSTPTQPQIEQTAPAATPSRPVPEPMTPTLKPTITYQERAKYTATAKLNQIEGIVLLSVVFTAEGTIEGIRVVRGLPDGLTEKAIEAARRIEFKPAMRNGVPVSVRGSIQFTFRMNEPSPAQ